MTLYVVWNVLDEMPNLPRSVASVLTHVPDSVPVVVDGRYPDYDSPHEFSTDGTREYAQSIGHLVDCADYECEKRTAGLQYIASLAEEGDFVLVLDADEEITGWFGWPDKVGEISFTRESRAVTYGRSRIYRWEPGLHFKHKHYLLFDSSGQKVAGLEGDGTVCALGVHRNKAHSKERFHVKRDYYRRLSAREDLVDA